MTEFSSESISISEMPLIDPFSILKAKSLINQIFHSIKHSHSFDQIADRKEVKGEKQTTATSHFHTQCLGKNGAKTTKGGNSSYRKNDQTNQSK